MYNGIFRYRGYYYDSETRLYYLQSRYYDPEVCRFINADSYTSTGQGFTGYNMFAYCGNNPVNYVDPTGALAFPGEIHNEVVWHIVYKYGYNREQRILYKNGRTGRADLISGDGQVWDVKRDKPKQIAAGKEQVKNYVSNIWEKNPDPDNISLSVGGNEIEADMFTYQSGLTTYRVWYRYAGDGVIAYDYDIVKVDYQTIAISALSALIAAFGMAIGMPGASALPA